MAFVFQGTVIAPRKSREDLCVWIYKDGGSWQMKNVENGYQSLAHASVKTRSDVPAEVDKQFSVHGARWI